MAYLFPPLENINKLKVKPTEGELHLINFLNENLDDSYEIYFQPYINGDNPDIVIMKENSGVMIIEVKDWNLIHYSLDDNKNWKLNSNNVTLKSPLTQVLNYKNNLFELHIENLYKKFIYNSKMFSVVNLCVYFHNCSQIEIINFLSTKSQNDSKYIKFLSYFEIWGRDSLNNEVLQSILKRRWLNRHSKYFDSALYNSFKRYLQPPKHTFEQGKKIEYNKEQTNIIYNKILEQKIKGIAGSGKTMVLAKKAVNSHKSSNDNVLILCFNITLRNYIHDKINEVREDFEWNYFHINNYHEFITQQMNNLGIPILITDEIDSLDKIEREKFFNNYYSDVNLFENVKDKITKYNSIFIDEGQDFSIEWLTIIKKYFLAENGTYLLFADEKQNVYNNPLESNQIDENDKKPKTNIIGRWNESLKKSYRLSKRISNLANNFQRHFFNYKYYLDKIEVQEESMFNIENINYFNCGASISITELVDNILKNINYNNIHSNDVCILNSKINTLVELDYEIRMKSHEKTITTVENYEVKDKIIKETEIEVNNFVKDHNLKLSEIEIQKETLRRVENKLVKIRKYKKLHFRMNPGFMKLSTIHSFKGWEINTLFLIIEDENSFQTDELIYTGLTRCKNNLIIFTLGNNKYDEFFKQQNFQFHANV